MMAPGNYGPGLPTRPMSQEGDLPACRPARWETVLRLRARYAGTGLVVRQE
jgi:hypothetical protein